MPPVGMIAGVGAKMAVPRTWEARNPTATADSSLGNAFGEWQRFAMAQAQEAWATWRIQEYRAAAIRLWRAVSGGWNDEPGHDRPIFKAFPSDRVRPA